MNTKLSFWMFLPLDPRASQSVRDVQRSRIVPKPRGIQARTLVEGEQHGQQPEGSVKPGMGSRRQNVHRWGYEIFKGHLVTKMPCYSVERGYRRKSLHKSVHFFVQFHILDSNISGRRFAEQEMHIMLTKVQ